MSYDSFKSFVEQVRSAANIVDVVGSYVSLRKKGNKHWACCPFHGEKTPSFSVDENKQLFYCFGCHIGGDVFKFIEKKEGLTFGEAAKRLAERYNVPVPEREKTAADLIYEKEFQKVVNVNEWANKYYVACLNHPRGAKAKEYLLNRGITQKIIDAFQIGYALPGYENLVGALPEKGIKSEEILFAGLSVEGRQGRPYDKFRDRVMIPIKNPRGKIVGFGGRVIDQGEPKYLNTAETKFFNKRNLLFAFDLAQKPMREKGRVIVVEGYMDAISLHAAGLDNVVASMGTAFSEQQADLLKRNTKEIVFCYDSDNPGRNASIRAVSIARKTGVKVTVAMVPGAKDPDEYIRQEGLEKYLQLIDGAMPGLQFQIKETVRQGRSDDLEGKVSIIRGVIPFILECQNEIEIADAVRELSRTLTIDEALILDECNRARNRRNRIQPVAEPSEQSSARAEHNHTEEILLALLLDDVSLYGNFRMELKNMDFSTPVLQSIFKKYLSLLDRGGDTESLVAELNGEEGNEVVALKMLELPETGREGIIKDCLKSIKISQLEKSYALHVALVAEHEKTGDGRVMGELKLCQEIRNEINKIYQGK